MCAAEEVEGWGGGSMSEEGSGGSGDQCRWGSSECYRVSVSRGPVGARAGPRNVARAGVGAAQGPFAFFSSLVAGASCTGNLPSRIVGRMIDCLGMIDCLFLFLFCLLVVRGAVFRGAILVGWLVGGFSSFSFRLRFGETS